LATHLPKTLFYFLILYSILNYTSAEIDFYLALYASVVQEPKHIMAWWHFCNFRQLLCFGSA